VRGFLRARAGAAAPEFAAVAGAFLLLLFLILEAAWQLALAAGLDHGVRRAARWAITGEAPADGATREEEVRRRVLRASGMPLEPAALTLQLEHAGSVAALTAPGGAQEGAGGAGAVVRYRVAYRAAALTPFGQALMPGGVMTHRQTFLARSEPYAPG
jgi:hypothetical protein